jgi:hypothetical protein
MLRVPKFKVDNFKIKSSNLQRSKVENNLAVAD